MRLCKFTALSSLLFSLLLLSASAYNCGYRAGGALCPSGLCCSKFGWCGDTDEYCGDTTCESQCPWDLGSIISSSMFDQMLKHRNDNARQGKGFYSYSAFINAARSFPGFGTSGDTTARKREIAAFFAQTSHETTDPVISFKSALWFWMTPQSPKPSCHDVIIGRWQPSSADRAANRLPGFGVITNIINGGLECGRGTDSRVQDRIGFYRRYCSILGVSPGDNLDCGNQRSFGNGLSVDTM